MVCFMNTQQKAEALNALAEISVMIRKANDWYVSQSVEVKNGNILEGEYGNGTTPDEAIENHWLKLVDDLPANKYLVLGAYGENRKAVKWNGYRWEDYPE